MKTKALLSLMMVMLLALNVRGQQPITFDTVHVNSVGHYALGDAVFEDSTGYMVFSIQKGVDTLSQDVFTNHFDTLGGVTNEHNFRTYRQDWFGYRGAVLKDSFGYYAAVARFGIGFPLDSIFLYRFDLQGDTIWTRFIAADTSIGTRGIVRMSNGDLLITGFYGPVNDAFVYRMDSFGAVLGHYTYPGFDGEESDVVAAGDSAWYIAGMGNIPGHYADGMVVRSDTAGNLQWVRYQLATTGYGRLILQRDGGVVAMGGHRPTDQFQPTLSTIVKYSSDGSLGWVVYPDTGYDNSSASFFSTGYELPDSSLIVCGETDRLDEPHTGMVFHLGKDGHTIWKRYYSHYAMSWAASGLYQTFWDMKQTHDNGMVLTGSANTPDFPYEQLWLVKLDSMGCLVPGCGSVGVQEIALDLEKTLSLAPNPAHELLTATLALPEELGIEGELLLTITDLQGRVVQQRSLPPLANQRVEVDVRALTPGTYALHLSDKKRWLTGKKFIKE